MMVELTVAKKKEEEEKGRRRGGRADERVKDATGTKAE
jgi:hypothetical protein